MERELIKAAEGRAIAKPNVLTLADFAGELCKVAFPKLRLLSDAESAVLIEQAIRTLIEQNKLHYFERGGEEESSRGESYFFPIPRGTFELVVNTIRQLKESGVTVESIGRDLKRSQELLGETTEVRRAADIMLIYDAYMSSLFDKFMDTYGQTLLLNDILPTISSHFRTCFPGVSDIFIDGFYYLEPPAINLIASLIKVTDLTTTLSLDSREDNPALFGEVVKLQSELKERGFRVLGEASRGNSLSPTVAAYRAWLRRYLFAAPEEGLEKLNVPEVKLWKARDAVEEVEEIARKIKLICEQDPEIRLDSSRIVVATPSVETYTPLFQEAFRRNEIPVQIADRYHLDRSPLMLALLALFDIARYGLRRREVIRVLSSPYFDFQHSSGEKLDARNILDVLNRYKPSGDLAGWKKSLVGHLSKIQDQKEASDDQQEYDRLETDAIRIRRAFVDLDHLSHLLESLGKKLSPHEFCAAVGKLLGDLHVKECLLRQSSLTLTAGTLDLDVQAYKEIISLLDDLESLFALIGKGEEKLPLSYYAERFKVASIWVRLRWRRALTELRRC